MNRVRISVIIPTLGRSESLKNAIASVMTQSLSEDAYEVVIVNNAPADTARDVVEEYTRENGKKPVYLNESHLGLHYARHTGANAARGDILVFCDDDIVASPGWLEAILQSFTEDAVGLVTGTIHPLYEAQPPAWLEYLWAETRHGRTLGYLSLLDLGSETKEIPPTYCYGCNFAIRRKILYACHGFNPDGMPENLICFRGDGETALAFKAAEQHYKILYNPHASIRHLVSKRRMTMDYILKRSFNQGISDSYSRIRKYGRISRFLEVGNTLRLIKRSIKKFLSGLTKDNFMNYIRLHCQLEKSYQQGWRFHQNRVRNDRDLLEHVLKPYYLQTDPAQPDLTC